MIRCLLYSIAGCIGVTWIAIQVMGVYGDLLGFMEAHRGLWGFMGIYGDLGQIKTDRYGESHLGS